MGFGATDIPLVSCAKCGERLYVPEASQYSDAHNVCHRWKCGPCDYLFETTVYLGGQRGRRRSDRQQAFGASRGSWW